MQTLKKYVLVVTPFGLAACASVWGFEEAIERRDASTPDAGPVAQGEVTPSNVAGVVCAPRPPQGFQGPLAFYTATGSPLPTAPPCLDRYESAPAYDGNGEFSAPDGECKCECDPSTTTRCESPIISVFKDQGCTMPCAPPQKVPYRSATDPQCTTLAQSTCVEPSYAMVSAAQVGGACTAKTIGTPAPLSWGRVARLCEPQRDLSAQCDGDKAPAPVTKFPYQTDNYCVLTTLANTECPATYPVKNVFYEPEKVTDTRDCAACTCGKPTGNCAGSVTTADSAKDCGGGTDLFDPLPGGCQNIEKSFNFYYAPGPDVGVDPKCDPGGGGPTGTFTTTSATTVCCRF